MRNDRDPVVRENSADRLRSPQIVAKDPSQPFTALDAATHVGRTAPVIDQHVVDREMG